MSSPTTPTGPRTDEQPLPTARPLRPDRLRLAIIAVATGILVTLALVVFPALAKVQDAAAKSQCINNLRQIGFALHNFNGQHDRLPPALGWFPEAPQEGKEFRTGSYGNVFFTILPYLEGKSGYHTTKTPYEGGNAFFPWTNEFYKVSFKTYLCGSDPSVTSNGLTEDGWALCSYAFNCQVFATADGESGRIRNLAGSARIPATFENGTAYTIMVTEKYAQCSFAGGLWAYWDADYWLPAFGVWSSGEASKYQLRPASFKDSSCDPSRASTAHKDGITACMADASVQTLLPDISARAWRHACLMFAPPEDRGPEW